jgi:hypothetical protein
MSINLSLFVNAQAGDYTPIINTITSGDAQAFDAIYQALETHASNSAKTMTGASGLPELTNQNHTIIDYIADNVRVSFAEQVASGAIAATAIATLKAVGVILTDDSIHIGLSMLGYGFYQSIKN